MHQVLNNCLWHMYVISYYLFVCTMNIQNIGYSPYLFLITSAYTFQVIQILGCTNLGGVYHIFCEVETNMFASSLFGLVSWEEAIANGLRGSLIFIFILKEGEEWWNYNHELSLKDLKYYTMKLMWDYVLWISSPYHCEFMSYWFYS